MKVLFPSHVKEEEGASPKKRSGGTAGASCCEVWLIWLERVVVMMKRKLQMEAISKRRMTLF